MRIVLAYSGGLDTTVAIKWLIENYNSEVIAVTVDVGQEENFDELEERAISAGASKFILVEAQGDFAGNYISKAIINNGMYEEKYPLSTALARPLIASKVVEKAIELKADTVAHGSTSKGNDQVRFDLTIKAIYPGLKIIAPARLWKMNREQEIEWAKKMNLKIKLEHRRFSIDENLWGRSIEGEELDDPWKEVPEEAFLWTSRSKWVENEEYITLGFERGIPVELNGEKIDLVKLIKILNDIGGKHGIGRFDLIENRLVGFKSREVYEAPAACLILNAHKELEKLVYSPREYRFKQYLDSIWADLVYQGLWFEPLRRAIEAASFEMNKWVQGEVKIKLSKGFFEIAGRRGEYSGFNKELSSYNKGWYPSDEMAKGFIEIWGLHSITSLKSRVKDVSL